MEIEPGKILIAQPFLCDDDFKRSVILISEHNDMGSMGFIINKPTPLRIKDVLPNVPDLNYTIYYGGPVAPNQLFFIYQFHSPVEDSLPISQGFYWGGDFNEIIRLLRENEIVSGSIRFFVGYSGWGPQQLMDEIDQNAWYLRTANYKNLMQDNSLDIWGNELKNMGGNFAVFSNLPDDPSLN